MGCAGSVDNAGPHKKEPAPQPEAQPAKPDDANVVNEPNKPKLATFWETGTVAAGDLQHSVPAKGPFAKEEAVAAQRHLANMVVFGKDEIPRICSCQPQEMMSHVLASDSFVGRAFLPHSMLNYCCGVANCAITFQRKTYDVQKRANEPRSTAQPSNWYLYVESVPVVGLFLKIDGNAKSTDETGTLTLWETSPIKGAFFSFEPQTALVSSENSIELPLHPALTKGSNPMLPQSQTEVEIWKNFRILFNDTLIALTNGTHELEFALKFSHGNQKFTAYNPNNTWSARFVDNSMELTAVSATVATGKLTVDIDDQSRAVLVEEQSLLKGKGPQQPQPSVATVVASDGKV